MILFDDVPIDFTRQPGIGSPVWRGRTNDADDLKDFAASVHLAGGRLAALWGSDCRDLGQGFRLDVVFGLNEGHAWLRLDLPAEAPFYPDLSGTFPAANRMQRATRDLVGIRHEGGDQRPWLRHGGWPEEWFPLRHDAYALPAHDNLPSDYPFVVVAGEGVHEIPVGPIHAGIIEPGHFRFSVVGERILRLEERLGYQHKGIEQRARGADIQTGARLVGRVSGDSTVAFAWGPTRQRSRRPATLHRRRARWPCARYCWSASASRITWVISVCWAMTRRWPLVLRSSSASRKTGCV